MRRQDGGGEVSDSRELHIYLDDKLAGVVPNPAPKTREDVEALKANWRSDPCWDIEETEDFEGFREELLAYRLKWEAKWKADTERRIAEYGKRHGIDNRTLAGHIEYLEDRINALESKLRDGGGA